MMKNRVVAWYRQTLARQRQVSTTQTSSTMKTTIRGMQRHFDGLYSGRNLQVNGPLSERALHMFRRIGRIADAERKNESMDGRLARAVSYFFSCVNVFGSHLDLELGMMEKFPLTGCRYCDYRQCRCDTVSRPDPTGYSIHAEQRKWNLWQWQRHLKSVYGHFNEGKFNKAFARLVSEFSEFSILNVRGPNTPNIPKVWLEECRREAADVFSWILTLAYVKNIRLQQAVVKRYERCPGCDKTRACKCDLVFLSGDGKKFSTVGTPEFISVARRGHIATQGKFERLRRLPAA